MLSWLTDNQWSLGASASIDFQVLHNPKWLVNVKLYISRGMSAVMVEWLFCTVVALTDGDHLPKALYSVSLSGGV